MQSNQELIEKFVLGRGLFEPAKDLDADILKSDTVLEVIAGIWKNAAVPDMNIMETLVKARMQSIVEDLVASGDPFKVIQYQQALLEFGAFLGDFERYAQEFARRKAAKEASAGTQPSIAAGAEPIALDTPPESIDKDNDTG